MSHDIHDHHTPTPTTDRSGLSDAHAEVIRATLPLVGSRINDITPVFYKKMFTAHPELIADLFNRGNQQHGDQAKALAASIAVFASVLVDPDKPHPDEMLARMCLWGLQKTSTRLFMIICLPPLPRCWEALSRLKWRKHGMLSIG